MAKSFFGLPLQSALKLFGKKLGNQTPNDQDVVTFDLATNQWIPQAQAGGGGIQTTSNVGAGAGLAKALIGTDAPFKSIIGELNKIIITANANDVTFTLGSDVVLKNAANTYSGAFLQDFAGSDLDNVNTITSNAANPALSAFIRVGNNERGIAFRDVGNTFDSYIMQNNFDDFIFNQGKNTAQIALKFAGSTEFYFTSTYLQMVNHSIRGLSYLESITTNPATAEILRMAASNGIAWRNNANLANLVLKINASDRLIYDGIVIPTISSSDILTNKSIDADTNTITNIENADIKSGANIAISKLNITGTPDGTKFLRDDGSWQTPAGGGAPDDAEYWVNAANGSLSAEKIMKVIVKTANETVNNSTTLQNDDDFVLAVAANEIWLIECFILIDMKATSDYKHTWTVPSGAAFHGLPDDANNFGSATGGATTAEVLLTTTRTKTIAANSTVMILEKGIFINGANAGNLQYQWAQNTLEAADTIVRIGSTMRCTKLA